MSEKEDPSHESPNYTQGGGRWDLAEIKGHRGRKICGMSKAKGSTKSIASVKDESNNGEMAPKEG